MKILIICSKNFYSKIPSIKSRLEILGHDVSLPNCYDAPFTESQYRGTKEHSAWKAKMLNQSIEKIKNIDAVLVLNFEKDGQKNYIGGATFLEIYEAFKNNKKIYFINPIPEGMLKDEIIAFDPIVVGEDFNLI